MDRTEIIKTAIEKAERGESKLTPEILAMEGMSSAKIRHCLNNLIGLSEDVKYLEIGVWKGSTFISALYHNNFESAVGNDNFAEFIQEEDSMKIANDFHNNLMLLGDEWPEGLYFVQDNFRNLPAFFVPNKFLKFNIYFYDGGHSVQDHYDAFKILDPHLEDEFIAIVDDWNMEAAKAGTRKAFEELKYKVVYERELPADYNGDFQKWWDGFYVAHIKKGLT